MKNNDEWKPQMIAEISHVLCLVNLEIFILFDIFFFTFITLFLFSWKALEKQPRVRDVKKQTTAKYCVLLGGGSQSVRNTGNVSHLEEQKQPASNDDEQGHRVRNNAQVKQ